MTTETRFLTTPRMLLVTSVLLAVLAALLFAAFGNERSVAASSPDEVLAQADEEDDADEEALPDAATISVTYEFFLARDPFESVRPPEPETPAPTDPSDPSTPSDPSAPGAPSQPTDPSTPGAPSQPTDPSSPGPSIEILEVTRDAQGEPLVRLLVGPTTYEVGVGDAFAGNLVVSITDNCVSWLRGDTIRTGCEGDTTK